MPQTNPRPTLTLLTPKLDYGQLVEFIQGLVQERVMRGRQRFWGSFKDGENALFVKTTRLDSLASRLRVTFKLRRRSGAFDWPLAELRNSLRVSQTTSLAPQLLGYGHIRGRLGLVREVALVYEEQCGYLNGPQWIERYQAELPQLLPRLIKCIIQLNEQGIHHLDLWMGNFMLSDNPTPNIKVIDFENCFLRDTNYPSETLGFQLGLLYEFKLNRCIDNETFDNIVHTSVAQLPWLDVARFDHFYHYFKQHGAGRKERYLIPQKGLRIAGKPNRN
jgi:hypothetical protein